MPTYEYICENCGNQTEQFQSITAKLLRNCSKCGKNSLKRLIGSGAGVIFKGSGFYETDYLIENYKKAVDKEKAKSEEKKTETKKPDKKTKDKAKKKSS